MRERAGRRRPGAARAPAPGVRAAAGRPAVQPTGGAPPRTGTGTGTGRADAADTDARWGLPPWRMRLRVPRAPLPDATQVLVVGAGFTGLAAALELAAAGLRVDVLEAARVGAGASGRTGGLVLEDTAAGTLPATQGCVESLAAALRRAKAGADLRLDGCLELRHAPPAAGRVGWPDAGAAGAHLVVDAEVPGGSVDPGALLDALAAAALRAGAVIHENAHVDAFAPGPPHRLRLAGTEIRSELVLFATNAFLPRLVPAAAGLRVALTLALASEPLEPSVREVVGLGLRPFYTVDHPYLWGRTTADGRLLIGAGLVADAGRPLREIDIRRGEAADAFARLEARVRGLHPALARLRVTHRWGGPVAFRAGGVPLLAAWPGARGVALAGAYAGHGVAFSLRAGRLAADALRGAAPLPRWGAPAGAG